MKNSLIIFLFLFLFSNGFAQNSSFEYAGRTTPAIKKEQLQAVKLLSEMIPEFSRYFSLPYKEQVFLNNIYGYLEAIQLDEFRKRAFPLENFYNAVDYVTVEISGTCNGKTLSANGANEVLTIEQKNILNTVDLGTNLTVNIRFVYKYEAKNNPQNIKEGTYIVTVVPETEAVFPGGFEQISAYFKENVIAKVSEEASYKFRPAIVTFTVDEDGQIVNPSLLRTTNDPKLDELLLEATTKMPKWKAAINSQGVKVKQVITIPFNYGMGC